LRPGSPAEKAGFKTGDKIVTVDGKKASAWSDAAFASLRYAAAGISLKFAMADGSVRQIELGDFY
jgi:S1-C subfamily serine protease